MLTNLWNPSLRTDICQEHNLHQPPRTRNTQSDLYLRRDQRLGVWIRQTLCLPRRSRRHGWRIRWGQRGWSWGLEAQVCSTFVYLVDIWLYQVGNVATQLSGNSAASSPTFRRKLTKGHLMSSASFMQRWATFSWSGHWCIHLPN